jgi:phage terminase large subunit GpA-like protein
MINALLYLLSYYPGPALYLISKDEIAREFGRERFGYAIATCEPLARKALTGRGSGELIHIKRFVDGKLVIQGGRSVLNLQSQPYRFVFIDEVDSLLDEIEGHGDPIKLAEIRTDSFNGQTLIVAFAHPSTRERGAGKLYYELSDQRRGHVLCPHCGGEFWLNWDRDVKAIPQEGMNQAQAERDPRCYAYFAPCCGVEITDAQRFGMVRNTRQKSTLLPEEAARRPWIGVHFSQLYMSNKPLAFLAEKWIEGLDHEPTRRVFINKRLGDVFDSMVKDARPEAWRRLIVISKSEKDLEYYELGQVPRGVRFLTAGQDSRTTELHFAVWGWGLLRDDAGAPRLCGWLVDYGVVPRPYSQTLDAAELRVFDSKLYNRVFVGTDGDTLFSCEQGFHDTGWQEIAVYEYCRTRPFKAFPIKGAAADSASKAPFIRWGGAPAWRVGETTVRDERLKLCLLNTFTLKEAFYGLLDKSFQRPSGPGLPAQSQPMIVLPRNVGDDFIAQSSSEYQTPEKRKYVWRHRGPNHWADCNIYAYAAALNLDPFQQSLPFDELAGQQKAEKQADSRKRTEKTEWIASASGGDWISQRE